MTSAVGQFFWKVLEFCDAHGTGLAAIAAIAAIPFLLWQITQTSRQERHRIRARKLAALATLPVALNAIVDWATAAARALEAIGSVQVRIGRLPYVAPPPSSNLIEAVERMIEADPQHRIALTLAAIISEIQVLEARLSAVDLSSPARARATMGAVDDNLVRAASIYALAESLLGDARAVSENVPQDFVRMRNALNLLNLREDRYPEAHGIIERAAQQAQASQTIRERIARWFAPVRTLVAVRPK